MKKVLPSFILISFCIVIFFTPIAFAHSGGTDSRGGHNSSSGYHYHHGYSAHQHIDGTCPYDFDDKTGQSSGSSGGGSSSSKSSSSQSSITHSQPKVEEKTFIMLLVEIALCFIFVTLSFVISCAMLLFIALAFLSAKVSKIDKIISSIPVYILEILLFLCVLIAFIGSCCFCDPEMETVPVIIFLSVVAFLYGCRKLYEQEQLKQEKKWREEMEYVRKERLKQEQEQLRKEQEQFEKEQFERERQHYSCMYGGKSIEELVKIPDNLMIGDDNLPREKGATQYWGESITVFLTKDGSEYHRAGCRYGYYPYNIYKLTSYYSPCDVCNPPEIPNQSWYKKYLKIQGIKEKYNIK